MNKLLVRTLTAALFGIVLLGGILYGHTSFGALFTIISMLAVNEFCSLVHEHKKTTFSTTLAVIGGGYLFFAFYATTHLGVAATTLLFAPYALLVVYTFVRGLFDAEGSTMDNYAYFAMSQIYAALPFALLNSLSTVGATSSSYSYTIPLALFIFIWCNDTGAFLAGCSMGKHRMWERISPKKTWEGFVGGTLTTLAAGYAMSVFFTNLAMWQWFGMAATVVVCATLGDLIESRMKREMGIKDSGNILPGHGGILDRFDSTLLAAPGVLIYLSLTGVL